MTEEKNTPLHSAAMAMLFSTAVRYPDVPKDVIDQLIATGGKRMVTSWRKKNYEVYTTAEGRLIVTELGETEES